MQKPNEKSLGFFYVWSFYLKKRQPTCVSQMHRNFITQGFDGAESKTKNSIVPFFVSVYLTNTPPNLDGKFITRTYLQAKNGSYTAEVRLMHNEGQSLYLRIVSEEGVEVQSWSALASINYMHIASTQLITKEALAWLYCRIKEEVLQ